MPLNDILLHIDTYPDPTPPAAIEQAVAFAKASGSRITALAVQIDIKNQSNWLADRLINLGGLFAEEESKSRSAAEAAAADFEANLRAVGGSGEALLTKADLYLVGEHLAERARTRDLCLVPIMSRLDGQRSIAEAVIFDSGRPVLVFAPGQANLPAEPGLAMIAWDGSRAAARAVADSLPFLARCREVIVVTVLNEKSEAGPGQADDLVRHLGVHGVAAAAVEVDAAGRKIGPVLEAFAIERDVDLVVMGAYGRSRLREFVLGGATGHMLRDPKRPILLAH